MKYYAVIDTNVIVSAFLKWKSVPGQVAAEALVGRITPILNAAVIAEYREVLSRPKFRFSKEKAQAFVDELIRRGIFVDAQAVEETIPDPKDIVFYEVVMGVKKENDAYLVTGNIKHFPNKPYVVTPREMLDIMGPLIIKRI